MRASGVQAYRLPYDESARHDISIWAHIIVIPASPTLSESPATAYRYDSGHSNNVFQARPMPHSNDRIFATCAADGQVRVGELPEGGGTDVPTRMLAKHRGRAHKLAMIPSDAHSFLSCGEDGVWSRPACTWGSCCLGSGGSWIQGVACSIHPIGRGPSATLSLTSGARLRLPLPLAERISPSKGVVHTLDTRASAQSAITTSLALRKPSAFRLGGLNSVSLDPSNENIFCAAGYDSRVMVFDRRALDSSKPVSQYKACNVRCAV